MSLDKKNRMTIGNGDIYDSVGVVKNIADLLGDISTGVGGGAEAIEYISGNTTATYTNFGGAGLTGKILSIMNDGTEDITVTVGSLTIDILGESGLQDQAFSDFTSITVTVPTSSDYRIIVGGE